MHVIYYFVVSELIIYMRLNFSTQFLQWLGLIDMLSANKHADIFTFFLLVVFDKTPYIRLSCKLVPLYCWGYQNGLLAQQGWIPW